MTKKTELSKIPKTSGIYSYINTDDKKEYIGQAINLHKRITQHEKGFNKDKTPIGENIHLWNAVKKYGRSKFKLEILTVCDADDLDEREIYFIEDRQSHYTKGGYNVSIGGNSPMRNRKHSDETKKKMSEQRRGDKHHSFGKRGQGTPMYGKKQTDNQKNIVKQKMIGNRNAPHLFGKLNWMYGKKGELNPRFGKKQDNTTSKYYGVYFLKRGNCERWIAKINVDGSPIYIGTFVYEIDCANAYNEYVTVNHLKNPLNVI